MKTNYYKQAMARGKLNLRCECGVEFERPKEFKEWFEKDNSVIFKWQLQYCDNCYKKRTDKAMKYLPNILSALARETLK